MNVWHTIDSQWATFFLSFTETIKTQRMFEKVNQTRCHSMRLLDWDYPSEILKSNEHSPIWLLHLHKGPCHLAVCHSLVHIQSSPWVTSEPISTTSQYLALTVRDLLNSNDHDPDSTSLTSRNLLSFQRNYFPPFDHHVWPFQCLHSLIDLITASYLDPFIIIQFNLLDSLSSFWKAWGWWSEPVSEQPSPYSTSFYRTLHQCLKYSPLFCSRWPNTA